MLESLDPPALVGEPPPPIAQVAFVTIGLINMALARSPVTVAISLEFKAFIAGQALLIPKPLIVAMKGWAQGDMAIQVHVFPTWRPKEETVAVVKMLSA